MKYNIKIYLPTILAIEIHCYCDLLLLRKTHLHSTNYHLQFDRSIHMLLPSFTSTMHCRCDIMMNFETISIITHAKQFYSLKIRHRDANRRISNPNVIGKANYHYLSLHQTMMRLRKYM